MVVKKAILGLYNKPVFIPKILKDIFLFLDLYSDNQILNCLRK